MDATPAHKKPGLTGYRKQKCRCDLCCAAAAQAAVRYRAEARKTGQHITPGLAGYRRGCRCVLCRQGQAEARKKYQSRAAREHAIRYAFEARNTPEAKEAKRRYDRARHKLTYRPSEARREHLWRSFKITPEQYQAMFEMQGGVCAICGSQPGASQVLAVDHDHACCPGERTCGSCIRGLLCRQCNSYLGRIKEDPAGLLRYLGR